MVKPAQLVDVNTLHNVHVDEGLLRLIIGLDVEIIANSQWTVATSVLNSMHASAP